MRDVKVSLVGYGIVGHGVIDVLNKKKKMMRDMGLNLKLISVTDHTGTVLAEDGVDPTKIMGEKTLANVATSSVEGKEAIAAIDSDLVVEVTPTNIVHGQMKTTRVPDLAGNLLSEHYSGGPLAACEGVAH